MAINKWELKLTVDRPLSKAVVQRPSNVINLSEVSKVSLFFVRGRYPCRPCDSSSVWRAVCALAEGWYFVGTFSRCNLFRWDKSRAHVALTRERRSVISVACRQPATLWNYYVRANAISSAELAERGRPMEEVMPMLHGHALAIPPWLHPRPPSTLDRDGWKQSGQAFSVTTTWVLVLLFATVACVAAIAPVLPAGNNTPPPHGFSLNTPDQCDHRQSIPRKPLPWPCHPPCHRDHGDARRPCLMDSPEYGSCDA